MTNKEKVLALLKSSQVFGDGWVSIGRFLEAGCGTRYGARVQDLRDEGYVIESKYFGKSGQGDWRYKLMGVPNGNKATGMFALSS